MGGGSGYIPDNEAAAAPVSARIDAVDVLRGLALLGVLTINLVMEFRVSIFAQFLPPSGPASPIDRVVSGFLLVAVESKAFALFSLLFGVGLAIQFEHLAHRPDRVRLMLRRLLTLLAFGLVHLLLIWNGDILTEYALAGFVVLPFLFAARRVLAAATTAAFLLFLALPWLPVPWSFPDGAWLRTHVAAANEAYGHGSYAVIQTFRVAETPAIAMLHLYAFPRTVALMLFGVLVWRSGILIQAGAHTGLLRGTGIAALAVGVILSVLAGGIPILSGAALPHFAAACAGALAPVVLAMAYAALVAWTVTGTCWARYLGWATPVGRMAFTNYVTQSVVLGLLFYGYGLGLMGRVGITAGLGMAMALYAAQVFASRFWLRHHCFGPLEWLWRTFTYGRRQPWRRNLAAPAR